MGKKPRLLPWAKLAGALFFILLPGMAQQEAPDAVQRYHRISDLVFPRDMAYPRENTLILRYAPSFSPESQIQISKTPAGYTITYSYLPEGSKSIAEQAIEFSQRTGNDDVDDIAAQIKISREVLAVPAKVLDRAMSDFRRISMSLPESTLIMDATRYTFWFENTAESFRMHYSFTDEDFGAKRYHHRLAEWMNKVKALVDELNRDKRSAGKLS